MHNLGCQHTGQFHLLADPGPAGTFIVASGFCWLLGWMGWLGLVAVLGSIPRVGKIGVRMGQMQKQGSGGSGRKGLDRWSDCDVVLELNWELLAGGPLLPGKQARPSPVGKQAHQSSEAVRHYELHQMAVAPVTQQILYAALATQHYQLMASVASGPQCAWLRRVVEILTDLPQGSSSWSVLGSCIQKRRLDPALNLTT